MDRRSRNIALEVFASSLLMILLISAAPAFAEINEPHDADAMWVEPKNNVFYTNTTSVGYKFNVTVAMNFTGNAFSWQAVMYYNHTQLNCTRVGATAPPTSEFMSGHTTTFSKAINPGAYPPKGDLQSVLVSESCMAPDYQAGPHSGTLFWVEFQILVAPGAGETLNSTFDISTEYNLTNTFVWDEYGNAYTFTPYDGTYSYIPEFFGSLILIIFLTSTLAIVIFSRNRILKNLK